LAVVTLMLVAVVLVMKRSVAEKALTSVDLAVNAMSIGMSWTMSATYWIGLGREIVVELT
jgi:hypothetical protein